MGIGRKPNNAIKGKKGFQELEVKPVSPSPHGGTTREGIISRVLGKIFGKKQKPATEQPYQTPDDIDAIGILYAKSRPTEKKDTAPPAQRGFSLYDEISEKVKAATSESADKPYGIHEKKQNDIHNLTELAYQEMSTRLHSRKGIDPHTGEVQPLVLPYNTENIDFILKSIADRVSQASSNEPTYNGTPNVFSTETLLMAEKIKKIGHKKEKLLTSIMYPQADGSTESVRVLKPEFRDFIEQVRREQENSGKLAAQKAAHEAAEERSQEFLSSGRFSL